MYRKNINQDNFQQYKSIVKSSQSNPNIIITKVPNYNINNNYAEELFQNIGTDVTKPRPSLERASTHLTLDNFPRIAPDVFSLRNIPLHPIIFPNDTENRDNGNDFTRNYSDFSELFRNLPNLEENSEVSFSFRPQNDIKRDFSFKNTLENNNNIININNTVETENNPPYYENQIINVENNFGEYYSSISENHINMPYDNFEDNTQYYINDYSSNNAANINDFQIGNIVNNDMIPIDQTFINDYHNNYQDNEVNSLPTKIDKLIESQKLAMESNHKNIDNLVKGISLLAKNQNQLSADVRSLASNQETLSGNISTLSGNISTLSGNIASLISTQETLSGNIASLISTQETLSGNIASLVEQLKKE